MKTPLLVLAYLFLALRLVLGGQHVTFAVSPWLARQDAHALHNDLVRLILRDAPVDTRLTVYDGWRLASVTDLTVSGEYRNRRHREHVAQLAGWFQFMDRRTGELTNSGAINIPAVFDELGRTTTPGSVLVLVGSPLFQSPTEPQFSFATRSEEGIPEFRYPSDGLLLLGRDKSPFGLAGREQQLQGRAVHFLHPGEAVFADSLYKENVRRFWGLTVQMQQGELLSFSADRARVLSGLFQTNRPPALRYALDPMRGKPVMIRETRRVLNDDRTNDAAGLNLRSEIERRELERRQEAAVVEKFNERSGDAAWCVGISWKVMGVDADLWVIVPGKPSLNFQHKQNDLGRYLEDQTDANEGLEYEQVNLHRLPDESVEVWVNLFGAAAELTQPLTGKFMVRHQGHTRLGSFTIPARTGNSGAGVNQRATDPHWVRLDVFSLATPEVTRNERN